MALKAAGLSQRNSPDRQTIQHAAVTLAHFSPMRSTFSMQGNLNQTQFRHPSVEPRSSNDYFNIHKVSAQNLLFSKTKTDRQPDLQQYLDQVPKLAGLKNMPAIQLEKTLADVFLQPVQSRQTFQLTQQDTRHLTSRVFDQVVARKQLVTNQFNFKNLESPFGDHSFTLQTLKTQKMQQREEHRKQIEQARQHQLKELEAKKHMYEAYRGQGVTIDKEESDQMFSIRFNLNQFELLLSYKMFKVRESKATIVIQKRWRGFITRRKVKAKRTLMMNAASRLQSNWRLYWFMQIGPRIRKQKQRVAITTVQRYSRGYLVQKHVLKTLMTHKVESCHQFFNEIKAQQRANARLVIRYHVKKYFIKLKALKLAEIAKKKAIADKKAQQDSKRKNNYGGSYSKGKSSKTVVKKLQPKPVLQPVVTKSAASVMDSPMQPISEAARVESIESDIEELKLEEGGLEDNEDVITEKGESPDQLGLSKQDSHNDELPRNSTFNVTGVSIMIDGDVNDRGEDDVEQ